MFKIACLLLCLSFLSNNLVYSQTDTLQVRKRALYKTFDEFINNKPTTTDSFVIEYFLKRKKDSTIIGANCYKPDSITEMNKMWGFCDGTNTFIRIRQSVFKGNGYFKIIYTGNFSFFEAPEKSYAVINPVHPLLSVASSVVGPIIPPKNLISYMIDTAGKIKKLNEEHLRKYLKEYPELLKSFNEDFNKVFPKEYYDSEHFTTDEEWQNRMNVLEDYLIKLDKIKSSIN